MLYFHRCGFAHGLIALLPRGRDLWSSERCDLVVGARGRQLHPHLALTGPCPPQETIEEVEEMLNNLPGVTSVHSRFYDLSSKYYQTIGNHASYYKDALRFLGCIDVKDLPGNSLCQALKVLFSF